MFQWAWPIFWLVHVSILLQQKLFLVAASMLQTLKLPCREGSLETKSTMGWNKFCRSNQNSKWPCLRVTCRSAEWNIDKLKIGNYHLKYLSPVSSMIKFWRTTFWFMKVAWLWCFVFHRNQKVFLQNFIIDPNFYSNLFLDAVIRKL